VGVERYVARALPAVMLVGAIFGAPAGASGVGSRDVGSRDVGSTGSTDVGSTGVGSTDGRRVLPRLHPPSAVHLLAARVYWGTRHPSYPSTRSESRVLRQTASYFERISHGRQSFRTTLTPWIHVDASRYTICDTQAGSRVATVAALRKAGYRVGRYNRLMILAEQCNNAYSVGQQPGHVSWIRYRDPGPATMVHELGHNLGLSHAYGLICMQDGYRVALGGTCRAIEYGDDWDAMGHSKASYSVPILARLGWAGRVVTVDASTGGDHTFRIADVEHPGSGIQAVRIRVSPTLSYWIEYQPMRSPVVGRSIPGVTIRRDLGTASMQLIDASPGNPSDLAFPDRDLENPALPVGSSLTTPENVRITTRSAGRSALVRVAVHRRAKVPASPAVDYAARLHHGAYLVRWRAPADHGQVVLGYRVTAQPSGATRYVRSPGRYRTWVRMSAAVSGDAPTFTVEALNQVGWSAVSDPVAGATYGPLVTVTSPTDGASVSNGFDIDVTASPDAQTHSAPVLAWVDVARTNPTTGDARPVPTCSTASGPGPYVLHCEGVQPGPETLTVHVENANGYTTDVTQSIQVQGS
jgi:hypothetical protein